MWTMKTCEMNMRNFFESNLGQKIKISTYFISKIRLNFLSNYWNFKFLNFWKNQEMSSKN
jgi:hypothetical protein